MLLPTGLRLVRKMYLCTLMSRKFSLYPVSPLNEDTLLEYKEALSRYPYCQYARLMFLLNLRQTDDTESYRVALPATAINLPDRARLKEQVDSLRPPVRTQQQQPTPKPDFQADALPRRHVESFSPWSQALPRTGSVRPEKPPRREPAPQTMEKPAFRPILNESDSRPVNVETVRTLLNKRAKEQADANSIIDRFLNGGEHHIKVDESFDYAAFDPDTGNSSHEDFSLGSETLAEMYLRNNAPRKAIAVYENLSLKFPEKNRYFANLISKVKKDYSIK